MTLSASATLVLPSLSPQPPFTSSSTEIADDLGKLLKKIMNIQADKAVSLSSLTGIASLADIRPADCTKVPVQWEILKRAADAAAQNGHFVEAENMCLKALELAQAFSPTDPRRAISLDNLAGFYFSHGNLEKSEEYSKLAIEAVSASAGANELRLASCLNTLAGTYYQQGKFAEAEQLCIRILTIYNKAHGPEHADCGVAANNLAMVYHAQGKLDLAEMMYERALPIRKNALGVNHPHVIALVTNYTNLLNATNKPFKAEQVKCELQHDGWHLFEATKPIRLPAA